MDTLFYTTVFLLPGFVIGSIIDKTNPPQKYHEGSFFLRCLGWSIINCACWSWIYLSIIHGKIENTTLYWALLVLVTILGAVIIALLVAVTKQKNLVGKAFNMVNIDTIHSIPTAWDYIFVKREAGFITVSLIDGSKINGWYSSKSFTSSETDERDLFIEEQYNDDWTQIVENKGVYIARNQIKTIEFLKGEEEMSNNNPTDKNNQGKQQNGYQPKEPVKNLNHPR